MTRLRRDLAYLEAGLAQANYLVGQYPKGVRRERHQREVARLEPRVAAARARVPTEAGRNP